MWRYLCRNGRFFVIVGIVAFLFRLLFFLKFRYVAGDSFLYGELATTWMQHGVFGIVHRGQIIPSLLRMPGYPAFLAILFFIFGTSHWESVLIAQIVLDVGTCFLVAELARITVSEKAGRIAFMIAALCPFLANYTATPLTETLATFFATFAFLCAGKGMIAGSPQNADRWWAACGAFIAAGVLVRPDGGIVWIAVELYLIFLLVFRGWTTISFIRISFSICLFLLLALSIWAWRNWRVFGEFQPLALRFSHSPSDFYAKGFERWVKTWITDYDSVDKIFWRADGGRIQINDLPAEAYDSPEQYRASEKLFDRYNRSLKMLPDIDADFGAIAEKRVRDDPFRYYVKLPLKRVADMWFRPKVEALPMQDYVWLKRTAVAFFVFNLAIVLAAIYGAWTRRIKYQGLLLSWILIRTLFLGTLANPEPRYTLECYPLLYVFASAALNRIPSRLARREVSEPEVQ